MRNLILKKKCKQEHYLHYFNDFYINDNGNIVHTKFGEFNNTLLKQIYLIDKYHYIEYYLHNDIKYFKMKIGHSVYEEPLSVIFIRAYFGYCFNNISEISGDVTLQNLRVNNRSLKWPLRIRDNKIRTVQETLFFDKWDYTLSKYSSYLDNKYYNKWTSLIKFAEFSTKYINHFNNYYRSYIRNLQSGRLGIVPEVLAIPKSDYYFIDFYIPSIKLGIEIDGYHHYYNFDTLTNDFSRSADLFRSNKTKIYRLPNNDVTRFVEDDILNILEVCFDTAGFLATSSISETRSLVRYSRMAEEILHSTETSKFIDYSKIHILNSYRNSI